MLLAITAEPLGPIPATDLGFVVQHDPQRVTLVSTAAGPAWVFWPDAGPRRATMAVLTDVDPVLAGPGGPGPIDAAIGTRAYLSSALQAVVLADVFRPALDRQCPQRPWLVERHWPVEVWMPAVPVGGDPGVVNRLFEPLGYQVGIEVAPLDAPGPERGAAHVAGVRLSGRVAAHELLSHLCVLLPVIDEHRERLADRRQLASLWRRGESWIGEHPERDLIARRYRRGSHAAGGPGGGRARPARSPTLNQRRIETVAATVRALAPRSVVDLGCGGGHLLELLVDLPGLERLVGVDAGREALAAAARRLGRHDRQRLGSPRVELRQSALTYRDPNLGGFDVACLVEVVEHVELPRLRTLETILFGEARPGHVIVTTPNRDYNPALGLPAGAARHRDHRFEWSRAELETWCERIASTWRYTWETHPIGEPHPELGPPTLMAVFHRSPSARARPAVPGRLDVRQVLGRRHVDTSLAGRVTVGEGANAAALELMARAVDPRWLVHLPPSIAPVAAAPSGRLLERPAEAFDYYAARSVGRVACQEYATGTRATVIVGRDPAALARRLGFAETGPAGAVVTRTGRAFYDDATIASQVVERVAKGLETAGLWESVASDWVVLAADIAPSTRAGRLGRRQHAQIEAAATLWAPAAIGSVAAARARGLDLGLLPQRLERRAGAIGAYRSALARRSRPPPDAGGPALTPIALLAGEGETLARRDHRWQLDACDLLVDTDPAFFLPAERRSVDVLDRDSRASATAWWDERSRRGGAGIVVTPIGGPAGAGGAPVLPALRCRGPEHLRLVYGPEYSLAEHLDPLRARDVEPVWSRAWQQHALSIEALDRFVAGEPLWRVHECVFGVLALGTQPSGLPW